MILLDEATASLDVENETHFPNRQQMFCNATASLDVENETAVQAALSGLIRDKTVLIIAHRMRTVMNADQIVLLSGTIYLFLS